jgi:hypothetical protein
MGNRYLIYFPPGASFETESQLRDRGTSRTPDILLTIPLGIEVPKKEGQGTEWRIVCWIDSKVGTWLCVSLQFIIVFLLIYLGSCL